ncbi:MAG: carboxylating nicotinate-nucleotide diphosphorylase [Verrucomicrobia bacterium]|nr:carboxylating nicotinate-nucleotide diphosphorylase [Verrucomicrobiota bacterium]
MKLPPSSDIRHLVNAALKEDLGTGGDVTSLATIPANAVSCACIVAKATGVLCGVEAAAEVFRQRDRKARFSRRFRDGAMVRRGERILEIHGKTRALLSAERVALNFIQRLSGIATLTRRFVVRAKHAAKNPKLQILDTRKTTPLLRALEKYAVCCGGGVNHRFGLYDMVLIKDNHLAALATRCRQPVIEAVSQARKRCPALKIEVECAALDQVCDAIAAKADIIMLDNMSLPEIRRAVRLVNGRAKIEVSGGVSLNRVAALARTGVNFISVGALTHSAPSLDFSLEIEPSTRRD